jgi:hypothetical protein
MNLSNKERNKNKEKKGGHRHKNLALRPTFLPQKVGRKARRTYFGIGASVSAKAARISAMTLW